MPSPSLFKWRHFLPDVILLNVRWYCRYALSYRDLEEMMTERGIEVDRSTINRWVLKYAPELDLRIRPHLNQTNDSWRWMKRMSRSASGSICIGRWTRKVILDFLLRALRRFFSRTVLCRTLNAAHTQIPRVLIRLLLMN